VTARLCAWEILKHLYLPHEPTHDIDLTATSCYSWVHAVCHLCLESDVLDRSLLAFCAVQIHIAEPHSISRDSAMDLYSEAVRALIQDLGYPHKRDKAETLGAILALSTCEVCYESSSTRQFAIRMSPARRPFVSFELTSSYTYDTEGYCTLYKSRSAI
jgi:hypothetical protein